MKKTDTKITRYESGDFWIDIVEDAETIEAWICRKNLSTYMFMFGCECDDPEFFIAMVEDNLDEYKDYYDLEEGYEEVES